MVATALRWLFYFQDASERRPVAPTVYINSIMQNRRTRRGVGGLRTLASLPSRFETGVSRRNTALIRPVSTVAPARVLCAALGSPGEMHEIRNFLVLRRENSLTE